MQYFSPCRFHNDLQTWSELELRIGASATEASGGAAGQAGAGLPLLLAIQGVCTIEHLNVRPRQGALSVKGIPGREREKNVWVGQGKHSS